MKKALVVTLTLSLISFQLQADANTKMWEELKTKNPKPDTVKLEQALKDGADPNSYGNEWLVYATEQGYTKAVKLLLEYNADPNLVRNSDWNGSRGALHVAAERGNSKIATLLLENNTAVDTTHHYYTPLHLAAEKGHAKVVRLLLLYKADVNKQIGYYSPSSTALHLAAKNRHVETVKILIEHGACVGALDKNQNTPLHLATMEGDIETVRVLLDHKAEINGKNCQSQTALHIAAQQKDTPIVKLLISRGANLHIVDKSDKTALELTEDYDCMTLMLREIEILRIKHKQAVASAQQLAAVTQSQSPIAIRKEQRAQKAILLTISEPNPFSQLHR